MTSYQAHDAISLAQGASGSSLLAMKHMAKPNTSFDEHTGVLQWPITRNTSSLFDGENLTANSNTLVPTELCELKYDRGRINVRNMPKY